MIKVINPSSAGIVQNSLLLDQPTESKLNILSYLNPAELLACSLACRELQVLSQSDFIWKPLLIRAFPGHNHSEIDHFQEVYKNCRVHSNMANGVYASRTLRAHQGWIKTLALGNERGFSAGDDQAIIVWNFGGDALKILTGHEGEINSLAFADEMLFSGSRDNTIKAWDLTTFKCAKTFTGHTDRVNALIIADGKVISGSKDKTIRIWDFEGNCLKTIEGHKGEITCLAFANGKIYSGSTDKTIGIWDLDGNRLRILKDHFCGVTTLAIENGMLFSGSFDQTIRLWDLEMGEYTKAFRGHRCSVYSLVIANGMVISGSSDHTIKIWDFEGNCLSTLTGHTSTVTSLAFKNGTLFSCSDDKTVRTWDFKASNDAIFREIAGLFRKESSAIEAMERFCRMPETARKKVYAELYGILRSSRTNFDRGCAQLAFHDEDGQSSTPNQKAFAIEKTRSRAKKFM